ncbi:dihydroxyacetone kinase family protein [Naumannella halotolerans]|uniref:Dihydroxyacetone kinase n=1 Tax=Naumannella halotolerans TaxID=993414 RepID=A0A4V3EN67_9ACTN|nr:dihydroxyacetone kinase family protein [Naumannella halotolerans]TDT32638.1 dihydroxyacetone kinase [Naumannella halotolerans]
MTGARASFVNDVPHFLRDALRGTVARRADLTWFGDPGFLALNTPLLPGTVGLVSGGGSGHEPMHTGFLGEGMLRAVAPGLLFTSPNAVQVAAATRSADAGAGVLQIVKNYTGDVMNFRVARTVVGSEGIETEAVVVDDDVATDHGDAGGPGRRGTGATIIVEKICGAAAARGDGLSVVAELGRRVVARSRSMAVAVAPGALPGADGPTFDLPEGKLELGIGIHGERGVERLDVRPAREIVGLVLDRILDSLATDGDDGADVGGTGEDAGLIVLVNGLGATHPLELDLVAGEVSAQLADRGESIARILVGTYVTAYDMAGVSITLTRADEEVLSLWDAPTTAPAWPDPASTLPGKLVDTSVAEPDDAAADGAEVPWLTAFVARVGAAIGELTDLDRRAGDGDFGTNMEAALGHFGSQIRGDQVAALRAVERSFLMRAGGTSGAVFGSLFHALAEAFADESDPQQALRTGLRTGLEEITALGGARVGDKTLVDALAPAVEVLDAGGDLAAAAEAAAEGVERTKDSVATKGRASYVGEGAVGVPDPGALVVSWLLQAAAENLPQD